MKSTPFTTILAITVLSLLSSCTGSSTARSNRIFVTISPLKQIVESIVGNDFEIEVLVPQGVSPETFSPSAKQSVELKSARFIFQTGLIEFETALMQDRNDEGRIINLSKDIDLIQGTCSHCSGHGCNHGKDPHIWTSPRCLEVMAKNAFNAIHAVMPDSAKYQENFNDLMQRLAELDEYSRNKCQTSAGKCFMVYHPVMTYFARDYGMQQIAVENEGKEPTVKRMVSLIETAREKGIKRIFYQSEFPASCVESLCSEVGAEAVRINPLQEDAIGFIESFAAQIGE